ncbi:protein of unknown function (plasmid) [Cupriavidus neocaledonicus]|uniref:Uncharacterized protein n=1 Tax=Cupriavidus neocaledonicus TaxID=1040979 RepID=A0A375HQA0_9BURK|nr:exported hypothetical protein [Cupriavidus neocaledonicus]SPD59553.1 protein of unknown function [Cupriavidus neocaledonicus]
MIRIHPGRARAAAVGMPAVIAVTSRASGRARPALPQSLNLFWRAHGGCVRHRQDPARRRSRAD